MKIANSISKMQRWVQYQIKQHTGTQLSAEVNTFTPAEELIYENQSWHSSQMMSIKAKQLLCQPNLWKPQGQLRKNWWAHYAGGAHQLTAAPWARVCSCQQTALSTGEQGCWYSVQTPTPLTDQQGPTDGWRCIFKGTLGTFPPVSEFKSF